MEKLIQYQVNLLRQIDDDYHRFLHHKIDWDDRMISVKGPRGSGKTTMLLQKVKQDPDPGRSLYVTADHPYFYTETLFDLAEYFHNYGGSYLFIDEVHKYPNWSRELKNIYDGFPELKIVFTSSSALDIFRGESDLSRRVTSYELPGMSFREYLWFHHGYEQEAISFDALISNHHEIAANMQKIKPLPKFAAYLQSGYLPFSKHISKENYLSKINNVINTVLESDLAYIENYSVSNTQKIKRLLGTIAGIVPFQPNISSLARKLNLGRDTVLQYLNHLRRARLLNYLNTSSKGVAALQKPDKIFLENTNLSFALSDDPEKGNMRETFLLGQLVNADYNVNMPVKGDILVNEKWTLEVGGRNKKEYQLKGLKNAYLAIDDVEVGFGRKIPLWLFGFLY